MRLTINLCFRRLDAYSVRCDGLVSMTTTPQTMTPAFTTGHVGINVTDLARSQAFYQELLGLEPMIESREGPRKFAFLARGGNIVLTLWEQAKGSFDAARPGLHHLSFQVGSIAEVKHFEKKARELGAKLHHGGIVEHAPGFGSGGVYFDDPDGSRLEIFAPSGAAEHAVDKTDGPACGFFG